KVDFYVNGSLIGSDNSAPFTANWNAAEAGSFEFTAVATDDRNGKTTSAAVTVTVIADNVLPEVSITSPAAGTEYAIGEAVTIIADATDADGTITKVDFYVNGGLIRSDNTAPFTANWNATEAGNFELTAVATDDRNGKTTSAAVTVTVIADNILPEVSITSPANGTEYAIGESVTITADATDADGAITKVDFYVNGSLIGSDNTAPFTANWNATGSGNFELTAVATDDRNGETTSAAVTVTVIADNVLPEVSITSPAAGTEYAIGEAVTITADATDADGAITKVDFYVNGSLIGSDNTAPYTINWNAIEAGNFELTAVATDDRNGKTTSAAVTVTVIADNILPEVSITSPANGSEYAIGESVTITADATDADGSITKVDFYVNGSLIGTSSDAPFTANWNATEAGNFELTAVATDDRGGETTSAAVIVTVVENQLVKPLSIKITSPSQNEVFARNAMVNFEVEIESDSEIEKVEYFRNNILIGASEEGNFSLSWRAMNMGNLNIRATVTDIEGQIASSEVLRIRVENNVAPEVRILSPNEGEEIILGTPIEISAEAFDSDGSIDYVEFYANDKLIGVSNEEPYSIIWTEAIRGPYSFTAKAFDDRGASSTSAPVSVVIINNEEEPDSEDGESEIPEVIIISPGFGQEFESGTEIPLIIMLDGDASLVEKVEYFANGQLIGVSNQDPFNFNWIASMTGEIELVAVAYGFDNEKRSISEAQMIKIVQPQTNFRIVDPIRDAVFIAGSDILIRVSLPMISNEVEKVEYFRGNQKIGETTQDPYSFVWANVSQGQYSLVARLVFKDGTSELSIPVRISVIPRNNGSIRIKASKSEIVEGASLELNVETNDVSKHVDLVDIYMNDELIGQLDEEPYMLKLDELPVGEHKFVARGKSKNAKSQVYYSEEINVRVLPRSEYNIDIPDILLEIKVGPNPTSDFLNLIFENLDSDESYEFTVQIVAMNGVVHDVYTFVQNGKVSTLDVNHLKNGAYMLNLFHKNRKIANKRFIKRR
ncbi:Ig-like domain-containing protein, partial [Mongoliibacter ruber]